MYGVMKRIATQHPGQILLHNYLERFDISQVDLAAHLGISFQRLNEIINGKRAVTTETAILLAQAFQTAPEFWLDLQTRYDVDIALSDGRVKRIAPMVE